MNDMPETTIPDFPFRPLSDIIVIEQLEEEVSRGGIVLIGTERKLPCGRVVAVGPGRTYTAYADASGNNNLSYFLATTLKVGDFVTYGKYLTGEPLELDGKRYLLAREGDIALVSKTGKAISLRLAKVD